jgi:hypothetical protein
MDSPEGIRVKSKHLSQLRKKYYFLLISLKKFTPLLRQKLYSKEQNLLRTVKNSYSYKQGGMVKNISHFTWGTIWTWKYIAQILLAFNAIYVNFQSHKHCTWNGKTKSLLN